MSPRCSVWMLFVLALVATLFIHGPVSAQAPARNLLEERPCGPDSLTGPLRYLVPQGYGNTDFRPACRCHDRCYENLNRTKEECDEAFQRRMLSACQASGNKFGCRVMARLMYLGVRVFGADAYAEGQREGAEAAAASTRACQPCVGTVVVRP